MPCIVRQIELHPDRADSGDGDAPQKTGRGTEDSFAEDLSDARRLEPGDGVYAVFATWNGRRVVRFSSHLDRLEDSALRAGFPVKLDRIHIAASLLALLDDAGFEEARIRCVVSPGNTFMTVSAEPYSGPPLGLRRTGVSCITTSAGRRENPLAKQVSWIQQREALQQGGEARRSDDAYEVLLLDSEDRILEGASSNFYAVTNGPVLETAEEGILPGIARGIVLEVAPGVTAIKLSAPARADLHRMNEAFLTSTSRGIVPIVEIDGLPVGAGRPGPVTQSLIKRYDKRAIELEEPLDPGMSSLRRG